MGCFQRLQAGECVQMYFMKCQVRVSMVPHPVVPNFAVTRYVVSPCAVSYFVVFTLAMSDCIV